MKTTVKRLAIITAGAVIASTAVIAALPDEPTGADAELPIVEQVEDHEVRIGDLEVRADDTDVKVEQNTADINEVQQSVGSAPVPASNPSPQSPTPDPDPDPQPEPEPEPEPPPAPHPRTVMAFTSTPEPTIPNTHICRYTLYSARETNIQGPVMQPVSMPCVAVGEVLPK